MEGASQWWTARSDGTYLSGDTFRTDHIEVHDRQTGEVVLF